MSDAPQMVFGGGSVAQRYDDVLVPLLFEPWAEMLVEKSPPEPGASVLDLATGTGIVASKIAARLDTTGSLVGADVSADMLAVARARVAEAAPDANVRFVEASATALDLPDETFDRIYCQQGFQFFPDKDQAAAEAFRVLRPGGRVLACCWCPLRECGFFGAVADCLRALGEDRAAETLAVPFDHMPKRTFEGHFGNAGFEDVAVERWERPLRLDGGVEQAFTLVHASPLGPMFAEFDAQKTTGFQDRFRRAADELAPDGRTFGTLASLALHATKPG